MRRHSTHLLRTSVRPTAVLYSVDIDIGRRLQHLVVVVVGVVIGTPLVEALILPFCSKGRLFYYQYTTFLGAYSYFTTFKVRNLSVNSLFDIGRHVIYQKCEAYCAIGSLFSSFLKVHKFNCDEFLSVENVPILILP